MNQYYVYILSNKLNTVLYIGITNNLVRRIWEHKQGIGSKFTKKYYVHKLVHFEIYINSIEAIQREKQLKAGSRKKKIDLVERENSEWIDLWDAII